MAAYGMNTSVPLTEAVVVTPNDGLVFEPSVIFVGGAGTVTVRPSESKADVQFTAPAGITLPVLCTSVRATGTSATLIVRSY